MNSRENPTFTAMQGKVTIGAVSLLAAVLFGCSTEVELNAPYESETVVFGLLDPRQDTQWVKINRTWLGESNNLLVAGIQDSSEYPEEAFTAYIERWQNGNMTQVYELQDTLLDNKEPGLFFAPQHTAYYTATPGGVDPNSTYRLNIDFTEKEDVEASTNVIDIPVGFISSPISPEQSTQYPGVGFAAVTPNGTVYYDQNFEWLSSPNATRYDASMVIYVTEYVYSDESWTELVEVRDRQLEWFLGTRSIAAGAPVQEVNLEVGGQAFFNFLRSRLEVDPRVRRALGYYDENFQVQRVFDFTVAMANEEFDTYLDVNEPITNIVQERPDYTNVVNGLGLFASRTSERVNGVRLSTGSQVAAYEGDITEGLNLCSPSPFSDYYCGE